MKNWNSNIKMPEYHCMIKYIQFICILALFTSCGSKPSNKEIVLQASTENIVDTQQVIEPEMKKNFTVDFIMGKFNPEKEKEFVEMNLKYASDRGMYMQGEAYEAFVKMAEAAKKDNVSLKVISAARNFFRQKSIWERKWNGQTKVGGKDLSKSISVPKDRALKILEYSSMPGTSRHHWGTDIDINNLENSYFESGQGKIEYDWLLANAPSFGFCQPYTPIGPDRPKGYFEEKWHWSYMPISKPLTEAAEAKLRNELIQGFDGCETASEIDVVKHFVLGIYNGCRH